MRNLTTRLQAKLNLALSDGADAAHIADLAVSTWTDVTAVFAPIVGRRGVSALYRRTLAVTLSEFQWLAAALDDAPTGQEFAALRAILAKQTSADAASTNEALLRNFLDLLATLIGGPLTERLLRDVPNGETPT